MSNHVFISYARDDASDFVRQLHDDLEKMGLNIWLDVEDIPKSANWALTIQRAIMTCRAFIFVITPGSYESKVCNLELQQVFEDGTPILPVYLKDVEQRPLLIRNLTYTDCREEDAIEAGFKTLFDEISEIPAGETTEESEILVPGSVTSGAKSAKIYTDYEDVDYLAQAGLFGRDDLKKQITGALSGENARVLLQAFGGVGKTALAAQISAEWIEEKSDNVLWLEIGASDSEAAFEALAHPFGASKVMASTASGDKAKVLRELIKSGNIGLVVLDDCWNAQSLMAIQKGIPRHVPLLVTARQRYPLAPIFAIPDLPEDDALALLGKLAPTLVQDEDAAKALCKKLGYHAFGVEVAGRTMQAKNYTAKALLNDIDKISVIDLEVPLEYRQAGRESIAALIETTLSELPDEAKKVFIAWGAFFSPRITPELMAWYSVDVPEITQEEIDNIRQRLGEESSNYNDYQLISYLKGEKLKSVNLDISSTEAILNLLQQYGLATRQHATQTPDGRPVQVASYKLHDLGFEYAKAQNDDEQRNRAVDACLNQIARHKQASLENFAALDPDIDNFMVAASFAMSQKRYWDVEQFADGLYIGVNAGDAIFQYRGYYRQSTILLQQAADAAGQAGNKQNQGAHLGNLGNAYRNLGQYQQAIDYHTQALAIRREIGDKRGEANDLGNLGIAYSSLGQTEQAIDYYSQALKITREIGDRLNESIWLNNFGVVYVNLEDYDKAIAYYEQALVIRRELGVPHLIEQTERNLENARRDQAEHGKSDEG